VKIYNIGCGTGKLEGAINCDINQELNPDLCFDFTQPWPIETGSADRVIFSHTIEHVPSSHHPFILSEAWRVLKEGRLFIVSYPEFKECAIRYLNNEGGQRDFWKATLFGRQTNQFEFHVSLMDSSQFNPMLEKAGFYISASGPELGEPYNTFTQARKGKKPRSKEDVLREVIWRDKK
jgi:predicted SAM-dependent methyltransferase